MTIVRLTFMSITLCLVAYTAMIFGVSQTVLNDAAQGSLLRDPSGNIVGSKLIAQSFTSDRYFHSRPSSCDYNASASCGSNISPRDARLVDRARDIIQRQGASNEKKIPADLVSSSGSGLDPHITEEAALFQASRVASARGMEEQLVVQLIDKQKSSLMGRWGGPHIVNVLELNLAIDAIQR